MSATVENLNTYFARAQAQIAAELPDRKWVDEKSASPEVFLELFPKARIEGRKAKMGNINGEYGSSFTFNFDNGWWEDHNHGDSVNGVFKGRWLSRLIEIKNQCSLAEAIEIVLSAMRGCGLEIPKKSAEIIQLYPLDEEDLQRNPLVLKGKHAAQEVERYPYYDIDGSLIGYRVRIQPAGVSKQIKPYVYSEPHAENPTGGWECREIPFKSKPLYNIRELVERPSAKVLFVEGEKTANAAKLLFKDFVVITGWGSSGNYEHLDLNPLQGRDVTIWPDNDSPGFIAQQTLVSELSSRGITVKCVEYPKDTFPASWDLADTLPSGISQTTIRGMLDSAEDSMSLESISKKVVMVLSTAEYIDLSNGQRYGEKQIDFKYSRYVDKISKKLMSMPNVAQVEGITYDPRVPKHEIISRDGLKNLNIYDPKIIEPLFEEPVAFKRHLSILFSNEEYRNQFLYYMAHNVQKPGHKLQWCPILIGKQGMGKSYFGHVMNMIFGKDSTSVTGAKLASSDFNPFLEQKHFVTFDEVHSGDEKKEFSNRMKDLLTSDRIRINDKHTKEYETDNVVNMLITSNDEVPVFIEPSDRRYFVMNFKDHTLPNGKELTHETIKELYPTHFDELFDPDEIRRIYGYLLSLQIPKEWNKNKTAPDTIYKKSMILQSSSKLEAQMLEAFDDGDAPFNADFFTLKEAKNWVKEVMKGFYNQKKIQDALEKCGCVNHGEHEMKLGDGKKKLVLFSPPGVDWKNDKGVLDLERCRDTLKRRNVF